MTHMLQLKFDLRLGNTVSLNKNTTYIPTTIVNITEIYVISKWTLETVDGLPTSLNSDLPSKNLYQKAHSDSLNCPLDLIHSFIGITSRTLVATATKLSYKIPGFT